MQSVRQDYVFIRRSTDEQDNRAQRANIHQMLEQKDLPIPPNQNWISVVTSRRRVTKEPEFVRLMAKVDEGKVGTIYVEAADRWGITDDIEWAHVIGRFRIAEARLLDCRAGSNLASDEIGQKLINLIGTERSAEELKNIAYRGMRSRAQNFKASGSCPSGLPPIGYGRVCIAADGRRRWLWCPGPDRTTGTQYHLKDGEWVAGPTGCKLLRKDERTDVLLIHPNIAQPHLIEAVKLIFELFTEIGLSRRGISKRLNDLGMKQYGGKPWTHNLVTAVLDNRHYVGDALFGQRRTGELVRVGANGEIIKPESDNGHAPMLKEKTHEGLISRETWNRAQAKRKSDAKRRTLPARRPEYYLRNLLVCGHCGKGMSGDKKKDGTVIYVCTTYRQSRADGQTPKCGYHSISHADAEKLIEEKLNEMGTNLEVPELPDNRYYWDELLAVAGERRGAYEAGAKTVAEFLEIPDAEPLLLKLLRPALVPEERPKGVDQKVFERVKKKVTEADRAIVANAKKQAAEFETDLERFTLAEARAASEDQRAVLRREIDRIEKGLAMARRKAVGIVAAVEELAQRERATFATMEKVIREYPNQIGLARATAIKRLLAAVQLRWEVRHHTSEKTPSRPRTTNRNGRFSYHLQADKTEWEINGENGCVLPNNW